MTQALEESLSLLVTRLTQIQTLLAGQSDGFTNPMTTQDDIIIGGVAGAPTRLAKGSNAQHLAVSAGGHLAWETPTDVGFANPMTTAGDLIAGGASGVAERFAKGSDSQVLTIDPVTHLLSWKTPTTGTVTSVGLTAPTEFTVSGSPVTGSGSLAFAKATQVANRSYAGPATGADAVPTFRALVAADIPTLAQSAITNLTTDLAAKIAASLFDAKGDLLAASADNTPGKLTVGANGTSPIADSSQAVGLRYAKVGLYDAMVCITDEKTQNTAGGTFTSGAQRTRDLNTERTDSAGIASVASNQITITGGGTFDVWISAPARQVNRNQARLRDITNSATLLLGTTEFDANTVGTHVRSVIVGTITLVGTVVLEVQHVCETTVATLGFGVAGNFATEVYTVVYLWRRAS